ADAEDDDERQDGAARREVKLTLRQRREDAPFHPHHGAHEGVHHDEQRELGGVRAQAEADGRARRHARPRLKARIRSMSLGFAATPARAATKASRSRASIGFQRFSKAIVLEGLPESPAPQTEPEKCAG